MQSIRQISRLNETELTAVTPPNASWHTDYRDTAYIHIGGLPFELSEGDILTIFSQYGNPTHINLVRDKETGKSRGFAFLKYEDQRSCDLAVDNLSGAGVLGRVLGVDHARYALKEGERETVGDDEVEEEEVGHEEGEGGGRRKRRKTESESESEERPLVREEVELAKLMREHDADDPMKAYLIEQKKAEVEEALKAVTLSKKKSSPRGEDGERRQRHRHKHHHHRSRRKASEEDDDSRDNDHRSRRQRGDQEDADGHDNPRNHRSSRKERTTTPPESDDDERDVRKRRSKREDTDSEDDHRRRRKEHDLPSRDRTGSPRANRSRSRERHRRR